jgi:hypothetical protein
MGEASRLHNGIDADAVETLFAEEPARRRNDRRPVRLRLFPRHPHIFSHPFPGSPLNEYMTIAININER